ncbi:MAG TPA: hypothetical protein VGP37_06440 [Candidatus Nanopelagicales bacterium]|nr:hypothetical protein [Candidatus Nanopelagicales bacterium]
MVRARRVAALLLALVIGVVIGVTGAFIQAHRFVLTADGRYLVIPWGAVVVVVVLLLVIRTAATVTGLRAAAWLLLAGWLATTIFLASETSSGDIALSSGPRQWGYLFVGVVFGSALATFPPRSLRAASHVPGRETAL